MALDEAKVAALASALAPGGDRSRTLIELLHSEAVDCATLWFDHDGTPRRRTSTFETEVAGLIKAQVGSGKSHKSHREIAQVLENQPDARTAFLTSTIDLGAQSTAPLEAVTGLPWLVYRGFEAKIDGVPICKFIEQAIAARRIGLDPYEVLCPGCPHRSSCPLWAQFNDPNPRVITTHAMLRHGLKPYDTRAAFDLVVIDEDPTSTLLADETYALSLLINVNCGPKTRATLEQLLRAATAAFDAGGRILIKDLPRAKALRSAASSLRKKASIKISRDTLPDAEAIAGAETRLRVAALLDDMIDAMAMTPGPRGEVGGCMVKKTYGALCFEITVPRDIHPQFADALAVQVLSATAQLPLLERSIPNIILNETPWQPYDHGKFVFVQDAKVSKLSLLDGDRLAQGGLEALEVIATLAHRHARVLLVCQQKVEAALLEAGLPDNVTATHFGAVEGLNDHSQVDAVIILGRPLPPVAELILQAEAAAGGFIDAELVWTDNAGVSQPAYGRCVTLERTATDGSIYTAYDYRHENRYIDAARQASTSAAVAQADRSRGQHRTPDNPVTIYDATGLDNVWQIDEVVHWRSLCGWFGAMEAMGFVPHPAARRGLNQQLAIFQPHRFANAKVAENYRGHAKRARGETLETLVETIPFRDGVVVNITMPGAPCGVPWIANANTATEAAALIRQHPNTPPGTKISTKARHTMRLSPPTKKETTDDCIIYELATGPQALDAGAAPARPEGEEGGCAEELVCEDGAKVPLRPGTR